MENEIQRLKKLCSQYKGICKILLKKEAHNNIERELIDYWLDGLEFGLDEDSMRLFNKMIMKDKKNK